MKYRCIKEFAVTKFDEDGTATDSIMKIEEGSIWEIDEITRIIGGEVHLKNKEKMLWLEIPNSRLAEFFVQV